jgi:hypothetical protein
MHFYMHSYLHKIFIPVKSGCYIQTMQQTMVNLHAQPQVPTFSHAVEPMPIDDWLKSVNKKLHVVQCNNREKVLLASHQHFGAAADWWDAYMEADEEHESINWLEFIAAFRAHHVPQ